MRARDRDLVVRSGVGDARSEKRDRVDRAIGSSLTVSILKFVVTCVLSAVGALAVTVIASDTAETFSCTSARLDSATLTVMRLRIDCMPASSNAAVYSPGVSDGKL